MVIYHFSDVILLSPTYSPLHYLPAPAPAPAPVPVPLPLPVPIPAPAPSPAPEKKYFKHMKGNYEKVIEVNNELK